MVQLYRWLRQSVTLVSGASLIAIAPFVPVRAVDEPPILEIQGVLEPGDNLLEQDNTLYDVHSFDGRGDQSLVVNLESPDFDTYLLITDAEGEILDENDDLAEENSNSRIAITLPRDGTYHVIVNGYEASDRGRYSLTVSPALTSVEL